MLPVEAWNKILLVLILRGLELNAHGLDFLNGRAGDHVALSAVMNDGGINGLADLHTVGAAVMECTVAGLVDRTGNFALQDLTLLGVVNVGHRDGRQQSLGVGMAGASSREPNSTTRPIYMTQTSSAISATMPMLWVIRTS